MFGDTLGTGKPQILGFFGGKTPKIPKFRGGDGGRNIGDFPHTTRDPFEHTTAGCGHFELQKIPLQKYNDL